MCALPCLFALPLLLLLLLVLLLLIHYDVVYPTPLYISILRIRLTSQSSSVVARDPVVAAPATPMVVVPVAASVAWATAAAAAAASSIIASTAAVAAAPTAAASHLPWPTLSGLAEWRHVGHQGVYFPSPLRCRTILPAVAVATAAVTVALAWGCAAAAAAATVSMVSSTTAAATVAAPVFPSCHSPTRTLLSSPQSPPILSSTFVSSQLPPAVADPLVCEAAASVAAVGRPRGLRW